MVEKIIAKHYAYRMLRPVLKGHAKIFLIKIVNSFRKYHARRSKTPRAIVLFITNHCQMRCEFCFCKEKLNLAENQLSLEEIGSLAHSLRKFPRINLTGGEPFLREDIDQICGIFNKVCKTKYASISTNGFLAETIQNTVKKILDNTKLRHLKIQVSIDAFGEKHDHLRGCKAAFDRAVTTLRGLKDLQQRYGNLYVEIASMTNSFLMEDIKEFVDYFQPFKIPIKFCIIRSSEFSIEGLSREDASRLPSGMGSFLPSLRDLEEFCGRLETLNSESQYKFWTRFQQMKFKNSLQILKKKRRIFPCYAGAIDAVIYNNGDVALCEHTVPVGNLKDCGFNFHALWHSGAADALRKRIKKCACIHGCNLITAMSYNDDVLINLFCH